MPTPNPRNKLTKSRPQQRRSQPEQEVVDTSALSVGENAAPDNPEHLMPGSSGSFQHSVEDKETEATDDLTPDEMERAGYPDPEQTPLEGMASTREAGPMMSQVANLVANAHKMLDDKLDSIGQQHAERERLAEESEANNVDYQNLSNAPKGDDVLVLGPDEPLRVSGENDGTTITLDKNVYRARQPFRTKRWTFTLVYPKGMQIPASQIAKVQQPKGTEPKTTEEPVVTPAANNDPVASETK